MSLALSCALANTLATRGIHARRVLTMVAGTLSEMEGVRVDITPLSDQLARSHPNTLWLSDLEEPEEETPAADPSEEDLTRRVATDMEREGRTAMGRGGHPGPHNLAREQPGPSGPCCACCDQ